MSVPLGSSLDANVLKIRSWSKLGSMRTIVCTWWVDSGSGGPISGVWHIGARSIPFQSCVTPSPERLVAPSQWNYCGPVAPGLSSRCPWHRSRLLIPTLFQPLLGPQVRDPLAVDLGRLLLVPRARRPCASAAERVLAVTAAHSS
eukprot:5545737-Pleurochrysis_carterae.AAC.3